MRQQDATFPTFTICPESSFAYKKDVILKHGYTHYNDYNCGGKGTQRKKPCPFWVQILKFTFINFTLDFYFRSQIQL